MTKRTDQICDRCGSVITESPSDFEIPYDVWNDVVEDTRSVLFQRIDLCNTCVRELFRDRYVDRLSIKEGKAFLKSLGRKV
ncbi:MAG: hypothetical protein DRZ76_03310 [Candidatus Nealsonbacteria bacterium]|nr:MAG: hypothetical protein DRZ76_03310 [Candidatus Nealsonbacteria bacterium]